MKVVFPDRHLARPSSRGRSRQRRTAIATVALGALTTLAIGGIALSSYRNNRQLLMSTVEMARPRLGDIEQPTQLLASLKDLEQVGDRLELLFEHMQHGAPLTYRFGFYSGDAAFEPLLRVFARRMREVFVLPAGSELEKTLVDVAQDTSRTADTAIEDYDLLKTYLMVNNVDHLNVDFAAPRLVEQWKKRLGPELHSETALLQRLATHYLHWVKERRARWLPIDPAVVADARATLAARDVEYRRMIARVNESVAPVGLRDVLNGRIQDALRTEVVVPGVYTRKGWQLEMRKQFEEQMDVDPWVLGDGTVRESFVAAMQNRYFQEYAATWANFLKSVEISSTNSVDEALKVLENLTSNPPLYQLLFTHVTYQTQFPEAASAADGLLDKAAAAVAKKKGPVGAVAANEAREQIDDLTAQPTVGTAVTQTFAAVDQLIRPPEGADGKPQASGLAQYLEAVTALRDETTNFVSGSDKSDLSALEAALANAYRVTKAILDQIPAATRSYLGHLFYRPLQEVETQAGATLMNRSSEAFSAAVCDVFNEKLGDHYPFIPMGHSDALLQDIVDLLGENGTAWTFFDTSLKDRLVRKGDRIEVQGNAKVPPHIEQFYNTALAVSRSLFPRGAAAPEVQFDVFPKPVTIKANANHAVSDIVLEVGEQKRIYRNGPPESWHFRWPNGDNTARLVVRGSHGLREEIVDTGDWALRRLLERAKVSRRDRSYLVSWGFRKNEIIVEFEFRLARSENPLFDSLALSCP